MGSSLGVDSTIFINFAILLDNVHLLISVMQCFRMQGHETHNYSHFLKICRKSVELINRFVCAGNVPS